MQHDSARATTLLQQATNQGLAKAVNDLQQMLLGDELIRDEEGQANRAKGKQSKEKEKAKGNNQAAQVSLPLPNAIVQPLCGRLKLQLQKRLPTPHSTSAWQTAPVWG